ncbi:hypothetical protein DY000_02013672 [Brassica cretica]|uniref:Uncharacterized protein n=1 Tax=Brassica cretica TaxID=69181 RepID=A0ABQ7D156_BRACR|nr:hypothetical protein DY000_02013672 [Brassica cretica]
MNPGSSILLEDVMKPPPPTQDSKIEAMIDKVLEGQQSMTVDFNGKIDSIYTNLNTKFETGWFELMILD